MGTNANRIAKMDSKNIDMIIKIGNETTKESSSEKLLGTIINNKLTWKDHIFGNEENSGLIKQLSKRIGILAKLRQYMPDHKFKQIVTGLFTSKMIYCMTVWGGIWNLPNQNNNQRRSMAITKNEMIKLQVLQNKSLRLISRMGYSTSTKELLEKCNTLSVHQLVVYHTATQIFKIQNTKQPIYHYNRLFLNNENDVNQNNTRFQDININRVDFDLSLARSSFFYQGPQVWSSLPNNIRMANSLPSFKIMCKQWIRQNIAIKP